VSIVGGRRIVDGVVICGTVEVCRKVAESVGISELDETRGWYVQLEVQGQRP
jgi:hypothetical protein